MRHTFSSIYDRRSADIIWRCRKQGRQPAAPDTNRFAVDGDEWPGFWFICEFANRQRAPDDGCKMFDDEGFQLAEGRLRYIRITPF